MRIVSFLKLSNENSLAQSEIELDYRKEKGETIEVDKIISQLIISRLM